MYIYIIYKEEYNIRPTGFKNILKKKYNYIVYYSYIWIASFFILFFNKNITFISAYNINIQFFSWMINNNTI